MEIILNLAWLLLVVCMFCLWLPYAPRRVNDHRMRG